MSRRDQEGAGSRNVVESGGEGVDAHHLSGSHADGLDVEFSVAHVEKVFETRSQKVDDENVVQSLLAKVVDLRNAGCFVEEQMRGSSEHGAGEECVLD